MKSSKTIIDLEDYRNEDANVFTGNELGVQVKEASDIVQKEIEYEKIEILVPEDVYSVNPTFLEEFLRPVVEKLGREYFYKKFHFKCLGPYEIDADLSEAVERILRENHETV